jgi:hypothetical protein
MKMTTVVIAKPKRVFDEWEVFGVYETVEGLGPDGEPLYDEMVFGLKTFDWSQKAAAEAYARAIMQEHGAEQIKWA